MALSLSGKAVAFLLLALAVLAAAVEQNATKKELLEVWFIPHSHDDVGWLKTIDEYYEEDVRYIYNTVVEELDKREDRKFIIVEMAFFSMWWAEATQAQKDLVYKYVASGKVEFVLGGWCMNDDADPTYSASINQLSEGHRFIFDTFGVMPKYGWHIDPFGLSAYYPTLFAKMGFSGHVINRIHYQLKTEWKASQHLEFIWRGSKTLGSETEMFTHVLDSHYSFPSGFNFERDSPITDTNIASRVSTLVAEFKTRSNWFRSKHLLIPGGDDFRWKNAQIQYENWDKLIDYINARSEEYGLTIRYATLGEYFEAVNKEQIEWPVYEEDFFPYADNAESYWTGFFTTHSELKGYIRHSAALLRSTELFGLATNLVSTPSGKTGDPTKIQPLRWATAEAQHHDGVTGTSKIKVIDMYYEHLDDGSAEATELLLESIGYLTDKSEGAPEYLELPDSVDNLKAGQFAPIVVTNSLGWRVHTVHEFVTTRSDISIYNSNGERVLSQIVPYHFSDDGVTRYQVFFEVDLAPAGFSTYYAAISSEAKVIESQKVTLGQLIENEIFRINVTESQGALILEVTNKRDGQGVHITEEIMEYTSYTSSGQKSGAYIFRPAGVARRVSSTSSITYYVGDLVHVIHQQVDATHSQSFRLYRLPGQGIEETLEVQFGIGPLTPDRECIVRFTTSLINATLFSDNNGIEMHQRAPASGLIQQNYYPMVSQAFVSDQQSQFGLFSERTVGVASLQPGQIETMIHRRCSQDDGRGMSEALDDDTTVYPTFKISFGAHLALEKVRPNTNVRLQHRPRNFYAATPVTSITNWTNAYRTELSILTSELPSNLHLLAFKTVVDAGWQKATVRLHHIFEKGSNPEVAVPVEVDLSQIFAAPTEISEELELSGIVQMVKMPRLQWSSDHPGQQEYWNRLEKREFLEEKERQVVTINPMQIKTYEFTFI